MKVYCASKSKYWPWWAALRAAGVPLSAGWVDWDFNRDQSREPSHDQWRLHWTACVEQARDADILLAFCGAEENQNGALIEVGAALGAGKMVYLICEHDWSWRHHPNVRRFATLEAAVTAILAGLEGERARSGSHE
jgi:hypothetical protein